MSNRARLVSALVAVVTAVIGFAVAALVGVRISDPAVQGALVGGGAGVAGGVLGALITAWATRQATAETLRDARESRFADRVRELASQMLDVADRHLLTWTWAVERGDERKVPSPAPAATVGQLGQELRLLVRTQIAYDAVEGLTTAFVKLGFVYGTRTIGTPKDDLWESVITAYERAVEAFEVAFRTELGRPPVERETGEG
jgi:hypothetical protein